MSQVPAGSSTARVREAPHAPAPGVNQPAGTWLKIPANQGYGFSYGLWRAIALHGAGRWEGRWRRLGAAIDQALRWHDSNDGLDVWVENERGEEIRLELPEVPPYVA